MQVSTTKKNPVRGPDGIFSRSDEKLGLGGELLSAPEQAQGGQGRTRQSERCRLRHARRVTHALQLEIVIGSSIGRGSSDQDPIYTRLAAKIQVNGTVSGERGGVFSNGEKAIEDPSGAQGRASWAFSVRAAPVHDLARPREVGYVCVLGSAERA